MTQTLNSKEVIESLQAILIEIEKLRLKSVGNEKLHKSNSQYSFMHYCEGAAFAYYKSYFLLEDFLNRLIIEK